MNIEFIEKKHIKEKPNINNLGFGKYFTDYMFEMDYIEAKGWTNPTIKPYAPISLDPATLMFHYGQSTFEGLKAYRTEKGEVLLFRPQKNIERLNQSNKRMCIPEFDEKFVMQAIIKLIKQEKEWIPDLPGTSLYIRPFVFATEQSLEVRPANRYKFMIILSPVGAYYSQGFNPIKIFVEQEYVRAVKGGVGAIKTAGNYAASLRVQAEAQKKGFAQVLWLDALEHKYIEEVGAMNIFFRVDDEIITPKLSGSILPGITRSSVIYLLKDLGYKLTERKIAIDEIVRFHDNGRLTEVFGTGTAAVISPVGEIKFKDKNIVINNRKVGDISLELYDNLTKIQTGKIADNYNWIVKI